MRKLLARFLLAILLSSSAVAQESLDVKAWNTVWDKLEFLIKGNTIPLDSAEILNLLKLPRPLAAPDEAGGLYMIQLNSIVGVIPQPHFALDISQNDRRLHEAYYDILSRVVLDEGTPAQREAYLAASDRYQSAFTAFKAASVGWRNAITSDLEQKRLMGVTPTINDYYASRDANSPLISSQEARLSQAATAWANAAVGNQLLISSIQRMYNAVRGSSETATAGIFTYQITDPIDRSACDTDANWTEIKLNNALNTQSVRNSGWNAGGAWSGTFLSIGAAGGSSSFSNVVTRDSDYVAIRFCKLSYVNVNAPWFSMETLRGIQNETIKLRPNTPARYKTPLGPNGIIPRMVKGMVVARAIEFVAKLDSTRLNEVKSSYEGTAGFGFGPFRIGGSAGGATYSLTDQTSSGYVRISADGKYPVILGVLLQATTP